MSPIFYNIDLMRQKTILSFDNNFYHIEHPYGENHSQWHITPTHTRERGHYGGKEYGVAVQLRLCVRDREEV